MSIYGTWLSLGDDEHTDGCAFYVERPEGSGIFDFSGEPCDCGTPRAPIVYEGSHVLPDSKARRGGGIDVAAIPDFIERDDHEFGRDGQPKDFLRLSVDNLPSETLYKDKPYVAGGSSAVVLDRPLVEELRDTLTAWLERKE